MRRRVTALALAALVLYPAAVGLPVMRFERLGHSHETGIVRGGFDLLLGGDVVLGLLILVCSVALPLAKLLGTLALCAIPRMPARRAGGLHRFIELTGRWGMLDVLLVAILAASVKLGELVDIAPGPGAVAFAACVALGLAASASFDPRSIWDEAA